MSQLSPGFSESPSPSQKNPWQATDKFFQPGTESYLEILFTYFLQYHLHVQLLQASCRLGQLGVALKGDLPIGRVGEHSIFLEIDP